MNAVVKDVMTPNVITVGKDTPFEVIAAALREHRVSAFPVLDEAGRVIGLVSESDLLAKLALGNRRRRDGAGHDRRHPAPTAAAEGAAPSRRRS